MTGVWVAADVITAARMNEKTIFVGTGAEIAALATTYPGMIAFCTSSATIFLADEYYVRNTANDAWIPQDQKMAFKRFEYNGDATNPFTFNTITGTAVDNGVTDGINGGRQITTTNTNEEASLTLNNIRHFNPASCTIYGKIQTDVGGNGELFCGISDNASPKTDESVGIMLNGNGGNIELSVFDAGAETAVDSGDNTGTGIVEFKIICGAANQKLYIKSSGVWTLKATQSTKLPVDPCQPIFYVSAADNNNRVSKLIRMVVYNNS